MSKADVSAVRRPARRRWLRAGLSLASLIALGAAGWYAWQTWGGGRPQQPEYLSAVIQRGDIEDLVTATGSLQPRNFVDVGAQVSGQLRKLHVDVGSEVREGDLLAEIDATTMVARVDASRAQLRSLNAQLAERQVTLTKAERDWQRQKNLLAEEATTIEAAQNAESTLLSTRAQINSLKAQIEQLQASMRVDEANLKYTQIYAPISGTVVSISARQGQTLNANQQAPTILRVADLSTMSVQSQVSEADVSKLRTGMDVYFTTLGNQTRRWNGKLSKVEPTPTVTNNVVLYNALFEVPNPTGSLMTQMTAQVFFVAARAQNAIMVPMSALTIQRGPGRSERSGGQRPEAVPAPTGARPISTAEPSAAGRVVDDRPSRDRADGAPRERPDVESMTPEQRQALREQRRAERERAQPGGEPPGGPRARRATVKVIAADGSLQEREITIGVSNRVHAEVLSGLEPGERVVTGIRAAERGASNANARNAQGGSLLGGPGMGPGAGMGAGAGAGRAR